VSTSGKRKPTLSAVISGALFSVIVALVVVVLILAKLELSEESSGATKKQRVLGKAARIGRFASRD
jgi:hypothetical protein